MTFTQSWHKKDALPLGCCFYLVTQEDEGTRTQWRIHHFLDGVLNPMILAIFSRKLLKIDLPMGRIHKLDRRGKNMKYTRPIFVVILFFLPYFYRGRIICGHSVFLALFLQGQDYGFITAEIVCLCDDELD